MKTRRPSTTAYSIQFRSLEDVVAAVVSSTMEVFGAAGAVVAIVTKDGKFIELLRTASMPADIEKEWIRFPMSEPVPLSDVARTGEPVFIDCRSTWCERYPKIAPLLERRPSRRGNTSPSLRVTIGSSVSARSRACCPKMSKIG